MDRSVKGRGKASTEDGHDVPDLLDLPQQELTPRVRAALDPLMAELAALRQEVGSSRSRLAELERLVDQDVLLASVSNRRAFLRHLERTIKQIGRYGTAASLVYFDVNGLKTINDRFGHASGDAALLHVGEALQAETRGSDLVGRLGGDEFGVVLVHTDQTIAHAKAARLAAMITAHELICDGELVPVSVAYGVHRLQPGQSPDDALADADRAMYEQKKSGTVAATAQPRPPAPPTAGATR